MTLRLSQLVFATIAVILGSNEIYAVPLQPINLDPAVRLYSLAGSPYIRIRAGNLIYNQDLNSIQKPPSKLRVIDLSRQPINDVYNWQKDQVSSLRLLNEEQQMQQMVNDITKEVSMQEEIPDRLRLARAKSRLENVVLTQNLDANESRLNKLKKDKNLMEQSIKDLENVIRRSITIEKMVDGPQKNVSDREQAVFAGANKKLVEMSPSKITLQKASADISLREQINELQSRVQELEKMLRIKPKLY